MANGVAGGGSPVSLSLYPPLFSTSPSWLSSPHHAIPEGLCIDNISALRGFVVLREVAGSHRKNIGCCGRTQKFLVPRWGGGKHLGGKERASADPEGWKAEHESLGSSGRNRSQPLGTHDRVRICPGSREEPLETVVFILDSWYFELILHLHGSFSIFFPSFL